eukprot:43030-Rhodomonas_salina.2
MTPKVICPQKRTHHHLRRKGRDRRMIWRGAVAWEPATWHTEANSLCPSPSISVWPQPRFFIIISRSDSGAAENGTEARDGQGTCYLRRSSRMSTISLKYASFLLFIT